MSSLIDPATAIGTVALSVADMDRSLVYYQQQIGLTLLERTSNSATLGVGKKKLLQLRHIPGARLIRRATGLYHFALRVPSRRDLGRVIRHFVDSNTEIGGASDHLVSEALYLSDPDGHGIEIYSDRPQNTWFNEAGNIRGATLPLDIPAILAELKADEPAWNGLTPGTDMGHIHLQVADIIASERFYIDTLGFESIGHMPSASFISAGRYHHHIGMNTWAGVGVPPPPDSAARLLSFEVVLPTPTALNEVRDRLYNAALPLTEREQGWAVRDPSGNTVLLQVHG